MATKSKPTSLRFSRIDFFRFRGDEFLGALFQFVNHELGEERHRSKRWLKLSQQQQGVFSWSVFLREVENGGLTQFFYNLGDVLVPSLTGLLKDSGNEAMAAVVVDATKVFHQREKEFHVEQPFGEDGLFARMTELCKLDKTVMRIANRTSKQLEKWLRENFAPFALGDDGKSIDPKFSGEIETRHSNGQLFEQATIRRGVITGAYRRHSDDGTLEHTCFYAGGEASTNFWPNGQPKHKTLKHGATKTDEWYFSSGTIQKRLVSDKSGNAIEPILLWHANGQLAEIIHTKDRKKYGKWVRFFDDGTPRLEAEYRKGEKLIVKNAWDDDRQQVVKNGNGIFFDDGINIDCTYKLFFRSDWTSTSEVRNGVRHGQHTQWYCGVLRATDRYSNGKLDGVHTSYYNNGRIHFRTTFRNGREIKNEEFQKFDNPKPHVVIEVEANARLYEAWKHPLLDIYPTPRNLSKVQRQIMIPTFLREVFERNNSHTVKDDYEDVNHFNDGITYMVMVNERGDVDEVKFSGSSVYSIGTLNDYPPIIRQLKFRPGQIKGRNVRCRVVASVCHTFAEADMK